MVTMFHAAKGKTVSLLKTFNPSTGKDSMHQTGFSDVAWGKATCSYTKWAHSLTKVKFDGIVELAQKFVKPTHSCGKGTLPTEVITIDSDDEWGCLVNCWGSENEQCKSTFPSVLMKLKLWVRIG